MERDRANNDIVVVEINFNSHAHVERDILNEAQQEIIGDFNSHAHVE